MKKKKYISEDFDLPILHFLYLWKVGTTASIQSQVFPNSSSFNTYSRLWRLARGGYINANVDPTGQRAYWSLTKIGFNLIRPQLPLLEEDGFRSESPAHDLFCAFVHQSVQASDLETFTEQQLRRYHQESYPSWIPPKGHHFADGYWATGSEVTAFEVELTRKSIPDYEKVIRFYEAEHSVHRVVWFTQSAPITTSIEKAISRCSDGRCKFDFISAYDTAFQGNQARVFRGDDVGLALSQLLLEPTQNSAQNEYQTFWPSFALDTRKCPYSSSHSAELIISKFCNWIRLNPYPTSLNKTMKETCHADRPDSINSTYQGEPSV